jgi:hypothetical protein
MALKNTVEPPTEPPPSISRALPSLPELVEECKTTLVHLVNAAKPKSPRSSSVKPMAKTTRKAPLKAKILPGKAKAPTPTSRKDTTRMSTTLTQWELYDLMLQNRVPRVLIYGPPGLGKSFTPHEIAEKNDWEFLSITMTDQTPMSELRGHFVLKGNDFIWHDGVVSRAWRMSKEKMVILEINEIIEASADAEVFLHNALDDPEFARLDLPTGETLRPVPDNMIIVATMNGRPEHLREALRDRFPVTIEVKDPHPRAIAALPPDLQAFAKLACAEKRGQDRISIRPLVAFAKLREKFKDPKLAAQAIWGPRGQEFLTLMISTIDESKAATAAR